LKADVTTALQTTVHEQLEDIPGWNVVAAVGGFYATTDWLRTFPTPRQHYVAVRHGDVVVAVAPCAIARDDTQLTRSSNPARLLGAEFAAEVYPVLFCGPTWGFTNRLLVRAGVDGALRADVLATLLAEVRALARREGATLVAFGYLPTNDAEELHAIDDTLLVVPTEIDHVIGPIASFDDYLKGLRAHRRASARLEMKQFAEAGLRVDCRRISEVFDPLCQLMALHEEKYGFHDTLEEMRDHFQRWLAMGLDDRAQVLCAWRENTVVGLSMFVGHGDTYYSRAYACHPDIPRRAAGYFNLAFYEPVRAAIAAGHHYIHFGRSQTRTKVQHGCRGRVLWFVLDALKPWSSSARQSLYDDARARVASELAEVSGIHEEAAFKAGLELHRIEALAARLAPTP
jgi:hypothetical protein